MTAIRSALEWDELEIRAEIEKGKTADVYFAGEEVHWKIVVRNKGDVRRVGRLCLSWELYGTGPAIISKRAIDIDVPPGTPVSYPVESEWIPSPGEVVHRLWRVGGKVEVAAVMTEHQLNEAIGSVTTPQDPLVSYAAVDKGSHDAEEARLRQVHRDATRATLLAAAAIFVAPLVTALIALYL
jgi:hypothetical protein